MTNIFVIADTHFGHRNILTFKDREGNLIRGSHFKTIEEHDEALVANWNATVQPMDHVYHLGDVVINKRSLDIIHRLAGHKRLVLGNHDIFPVETYLAAGFEKVYGVRVFPAHGLIFSHIPLHPNSLVERGWKNIHGHMHNNKLDDEVHYQCVSVEHTEYKPLLLMR